MLPAARRLRHRAEFSETVRRGRRAGASMLVGHLLRTARPTPARIGFVVGRSVGPAVVRNRVRRRLRHQLAARLALVPDGSQLVVRALPEAADCSSADLARALDRLLARLAPVTS